MLHIYIYISVCVFACVISYIFMYIFKYICVYLERETRVRFLEDGAISKVHFQSYLFTTYYTYIHFSLLHCNSEHIVHKLSTEFQ